MDVNGNSSVQSNGFSQHVNRFKVYKHLGIKWTGCVMARPNDYDLEDTPPSMANPETLFVPWLWPDEPDFGLYPNSYLSDHGGSSFTEIAKNVAKYGINSGDEVSWTMVMKTMPYIFYANYFEPQGPNFTCDTQPITPLTDDYSSFSSKIDTLTANGGTNLLHGLSWGFKVLSPDALFKEGAQYDSGVEKVIIFFTDGENAINGLDNELKSEYTPWGYAVDFMPQGTDYSTKSINSFLDKRTRELCNNIKKTGINIYSIGLSVPTKESETLLNECASGNGNFRSITNETEIGDAFDAIFKKVTELHISG